MNDDGSCTVECSPLTYKQPVPDVNFIAWFATPQPTPVDHDLFSDAIKDEVGAGFEIKHASNQA